MHILNIKTKKTICLPSEQGSHQKKKSLVVNPRFLSAHRIAPSALDTHFAHNEGVWRCHAHELSTDAIYRRIQD